MDKRKRKIVKIIPIVSLSISIFTLVVSFFIRDIPQNEAYIFENGKIIVHSWHDIFVVIVVVDFIGIWTSAVLATILCTASKKKTNEKIALTVFLTWLIVIISTVMILYSYLMVIGLWTKSDYYPCCYEFTDGQHKIVIEEESFLLMGQGTIYQIKDGDEAVVIGHFSTDDGGRNNGNYDIKWYNDYAEITYKTFTQSGHKATETVRFK